MTLLDLISRDPSPEPWAAGDNIPWHEPGFSARMLAEHLSQEHDAASRRSAKIEAQVAWIHRHVLVEAASRVLDLGCGPGFYCSRLARLGHTCIGVDYSPASIEYARAEAEREGLDCAYVLEDVRSYDPHGLGDLAMMLYGEPNVFRREDLRAILGRARGVLSPGGRVLLEPHTFEAVEAIGRSGTSWYTAPAGLFSDAPHLVLQENQWDDATRTATTRFHVIDAATGQVATHGRTMQAYTPEDYAALLHECGFGGVIFHPSLTGEPDETQAALIVVVAQVHAG